MKKRNLTSLLFLVVIGGFSCHNLGSRDVLIEVQSLLGLQVAELVNEPQVPGKYKVTWSPQPSQVTAGDYTFRFFLDGEQQKQQEVLYSGGAATFSFSYKVPWRFQ